MATFREWITRVPVDERPIPGDERYTTLTAAGVQVTCNVGHLPDKLYVEIDAALNAKAAAEGVNMPVALDPAVWLHRCRRCKAPFIALPQTKMCSDACRAAARQDAVLKSKAKRASRHESRERSGRWFVCRQCGKRSGAFRSTKQFCSLKCRVAAHRGVPAKPPEPMTAEELDAQIAIMQSLVGAAQCGYLDAATLKSVMHRALALQAERAALDQPGQSSP
jgi:hypothetical protein